MQLLTVTELTTYLRQRLEGDPVLRDLWVSGEVSNLTRSGAGHSYFTLKDGKSQLRAILFRGYRGGELLANGVQVNAHGRISLYETRGDLQLNADIVQPSGLGLLALEFERLKAQLDGEGLFDVSRKRPLPAFPQRIGLVTSEQGAVLHDIMNVISRRYPLVELVLCPAAVQGDRAPAEVVDAIRTLNDEPDMDLIIVARGGGSLEDLWAFNTEVVARAIYGSAAPVVSAVGHETDFTIADFVADLRAPTPSAAAELVTPTMALLAADVSALARRADAAVSYVLIDRIQQVEGLAHRMKGRLPDITVLRLHVDEQVAKGWQYLNRHLRYRREQFNGLERHLGALNPLAILDRGYAVITAPDGRAITSASQVREGDRITATVKDGEFEANVNAPAKAIETVQQESTANAI